MIVPFEWAKPDGDYSQMGMEKPAAGQYLAHHLESGAVSGGAGRDFTAGNRWLVGAWLSAFISLRRAGLKVAMPRELAAWDSFARLWLPSPLTSTEMDLVHALFRSAHPAVEAGCLVGEGRGITVLANHSNADVKTTLTSSQKVTWLARLLPEGRQPIDGRDGTWQVEVGAWDGAILEWISPRI